MRNVARGVGLAFFGGWYLLKNVLFKNLLPFVLLPWTTARRWSENLDRYSEERGLVRFFVPGTYSSLFVIATVMTYGFCGAREYPNTLFTQSWLFQVWYLTLPIAAGIVLSGLYEIGRAYAPPKVEDVVAKPQAVLPAETNKEVSVEPKISWPPATAGKSATKVDDPTVPSAARNAYEHEINGLKKALDDDEKAIKRRNWIVGGILTIIILFGAAVGYMLERGVLIVEVDGVSMAQELEKAQAEIERLKGEIPAIEDLQKKLEEMMEKAKEMVPPGILPPEKDKDDDF
ncbi:MAG: hypothetical protein G01um10143_798 [Parcubacteria group bacterium Gr01-1014_3]|nr:MAG: hypothetical protein G01um10143_798 [Parcubacteria group bacterium Gr01-1014_3]